MFLIGRFAAQQYSFRLVKNKSMILTSMLYFDESDFPEVFHFSRPNDAYR